MDALPADPAVLTRGPLPLYRAGRLAGDLIADEAQELVAERLQDLWAKLRGYDPVPKPAANASLLARFMRRKAAEGANEDRPNGLYLVGEVGRGKSMLMDLFFAAAAVRRKRRIHFHRFMQDVHKRIHAWKLAGPNGEDPIPPLADAIAAEAALLCFDEFQVNDIADAMILGRLFQALFDRAVVVVATSNTLPDDLFKDQPGRDAFLPFIALLKANLDVLVMESGQDYRRDRLRGMPTWYVPADRRAAGALGSLFAGLTGHAPPRPERLIVMGRTLFVPVAAAGVARFDFAALCDTALGAGDYLALATHFYCLVVDRIPRLSPAAPDVARRFIILIDALYEHRVKLAASAMAWPDALYDGGKEGGREAGLFARTASRLAEMQSQDYLALPHLT